MFDTNEATRLIKLAGLKVTQARVAVLSALLHSKHGMSHQEIDRRLRENGHRIDRVTIYRTLYQLAEQGIIHKWIGLDRSFLFAGQRDDMQEASSSWQSEHPHFICESCNTTYCLGHLTLMKAPVDVPIGFILKHAELQLFGICPQCQ